jgi:hypothetical protein
LPQYLQVSWPQAPSPRPIDRCWLSSLRRRASALVR